MFKNKLFSLTKETIKPKLLSPKLKFNSPQIESNTTDIKRLAPNLYLDYNLDDRVNEPQKRPLVLLMSWLKAKEKYLNVYNDFYIRRGFDVLTAKVTSYDMFYPDYTGKLCLDALEKELAHYDSIFIHAFSFGIYVLGTILLELEKRKANNTDVEALQSALVFENRIKAIAFDSAITADLILGLPQSINDLPRSYKLYMKSHQMFLKMHKTTANYLLATNEIIFNSPLRAPALVMVSDSDIFSNVWLSEKIVSFWRNKDIDVKYQRFKNGPHVQLMKYNQNEYVQLIDELIERAHYKTINEKVALNF